ncbi:MAG: hypothetical protein WD669_02075 [Pirellulales bacterium]
MSRCSRLGIGVLLIVAVHAARPIFGQTMRGSIGERPEPFADIPLFPDGGTVPKEASLTEATLPTVGPETRKAVLDVLQVNDLGDPQLLIFEGVSRFSEQQIRLALALDIPYQAAVRPSSDTAEFLDVLEKRLREGYRHSGCPEAKVSARRDSQRRSIVVRVEEGPRYKMGQIHVRGSGAIDEKAVAKWLTSPQEFRPWQFEYEKGPIEVSIRSYPSNASIDPITYWRPGKAVDYRSEAKTSLEKGIQIALAEIGFGSTKFHSDFVVDPATGAVDLVIHVPDDARRCVVDEIRVEGLSRDNRESLLNFLGIADGVALDATLLQHINDKVADSCRFWAHGMHLVLPSQTAARLGSPQKTVLSLAFTEYPPMPSLSEPLSAVDEALRKAAHWIQSLGTNTDEKDLILTFGPENVSSAEVAPKTPAVVEGNASGRIVISRRGIVADVKLASGNNWRMDHAFSVTARSISIVDWRNHEKFLSVNSNRPVPLKFMLKVLNGHNPDNTYASNLSTGLAVSMKSPAWDGIATEIRVEPVALVYLAHRPDGQAAINDGVLSVTSGDDEMQFNATTGEFIKFERRNHENRSIVVSSAHLEAGAWEKAIAAMRQRAAEFPDKCDEQHPAQSVAVFLLAQFADQPYVKQRPVLEIGLRQLHLLMKVTDLDKFVAAAKSSLALAFDAESNREFGIPRLEYTADSEFEEFANQLFPWVPMLADRVFPRGSWPWTLSRELCFYTHAAAKDGEFGEDFRKKSQAELNRLHATGALGPVSLFLATRMARPWKEYANFTAQQGLSDLSDEAFLKDVRLLTDGDQWLASATRVIVEQLGKSTPEEQDQLIRFLPEGSREPIARLIKVRREHPTELPSVSIMSALLDSWHHGLRETVEAELRRFAAQVAESPAVETRTKK